MTTQLTDPSSGCEPGVIPPGAPGGWGLVERATMLLTTVLLGYTIMLPLGVTVGYLAAAASAPMWVLCIRRYVGATTMLLLAGLCALSGAVLTLLAAPDRPTALGHAVEATIVLLGPLCGVGVLLWGRTLMSTGAVGLAFGIGLLLDVSNVSPLFSTNTWKFGFAVPVAVIALSLASLTGRRWVELLTLLGLAVASGVTDSRSSFYLLLVAVLLVLWQLLPLGAGTRPSTTRVLIGFAVAIVLLYNGTEALFLDGALGEETQQRSQVQVDASGSLIIGGRPELAATIALMEHDPWGFGSGALANHADVDVAKSGMAATNYDPDNGYVERYMFGTEVELHSIFGDLWARFGLPGLVLAAFVLVVALGRLGHDVAHRSASALVVYAGAKTLWNLAFGPLYSSTALLMLFLGLALADRGPPPSPAPSSTAARRSGIRRRSRVERS